ncbi:MAG TPA: glycosyltransferase family 4 protein [Solirubrobacteraceae bacterium]
MTELRVDVVDPSAYTPPYDHALCSALGLDGAQVRLVTSEFAYGELPSPEHYARREIFYRRAVGRAGSRLRLMTKLLEHGPDMARYRRLARWAEVVHFQWFAVGWLDRLLLPRRPIVVTAHDLLPREPRPGQVAAQRRLYDAVDAVVAHSEFGRGQLVDRVGVPSEKVTVIHHGAFDHLAALAPGRLPPELVEEDSDPQAPVALFFGLLRPYKGLDVLLDAWRSLSLDGMSGPGPRLWIVGHPRMPLEPLRTAAPPGVRFVPRFVSDSALAACFDRASLVVLPYTSTERFDSSGVLATALAFGKPSILSDLGGFPELAATGAARLVAPADPNALARALSELLGDQAARERLAANAAVAAAGPYSWADAARRTLALYRSIA